MIISKFEVSLKSDPYRKVSKKEKSRRKLEGIPPGSTGRSLGIDRFLSARYGLAQLNVVFGRGVAKVGVNLDEEGCLAFQLGR